MPPPDAPNPQTRRALDVFTVALPIAILAALLVAYATSPGFYLRYVLEGQTREQGAVEIITFAALLLAGLLLIPSTLRLLPARRERGGWLAIGVVGSLMLASFFVAGEEIDWGDSWGLWGDAAPKGDMTHLNVHNTSPLPIKSIGSLYLVAVFFALPLAWHVALKTRAAFTGLRHAVPELPVVIAMAIAFGWKLFKSIYVALVGKDNLGQHGDDNFYWNFVEQINEHKELLLATTILCYAIYRLTTPRHIPTEDAT